MTRGPVGSRTLPDHDSCTPHKKYKLGCDQFEELIERSGQRCEICGVDGTHERGGKLSIDHDHDLPRWAVRGLLCSPCNRVLSSRVAELRPPWALAYLDNAWWLKECERANVPVTIASEPDYGSVVIDQYGATWLREGDGLWRPWGRDRPGISSADWQWLYRLRGPHNLAPVDLWAAPESERNSALEWLIHHSERAALQALLSEHSGKDIPIYKTEAFGHLLVAYMDGEYEPRLPWARRTAR